MKVACSFCSEEHDVSHMEPSFALPDVVAAMGAVERDRLAVVTSKNVCSIGTAQRGFFRVLLPIPVEGEGPCNWGVWVEVYTYAQFLIVVGKWDDEALLQEIFPAKLANDLPSYPDSLGLSGVVGFHDMKTIGRFELKSRLGLPPLHPLVHDQRSGVTGAPGVPAPGTMVKRGNAGESK